MWQVASISSAYSWQFKSLHQQQLDACTERCRVPQDRNGQQLGPASIDHSGTPLVHFEGFNPTALGNRLQPSAQVVTGVCCWCCCHCRLQPGLLSC